MQLSRLNRVLVILVSVVTAVGLSGGAWAWEVIQSPSGQAAVATPSGQGVSARGSVLVPQTQVVYQTVNSFECVQVPVTRYQTHYRTEYRTENVPVTRTVSEVVNESRTLTRFVPQQKTVNKQFTRYVCEPQTVTQKCYRPVLVTKNVNARSIRPTARPRWSTRSSLAYVSDCVTETVPVTKYHKVVEPQVCNVTQRVPVTSYVPVVTLCSHLRPQVRCRRLWRVRRSDDLRSLCSDHDLCAPSRCRSRGRSSSTYPRRRTFSERAGSWSR